MKPLTPQDRADLALAILCWRYVGHRLPNGIPSPETMDRATRALKLAKQLGIFAEYWAVMQAVDVHSITIKNLEAPPVHKGGRKKKVAPAK